MINTKLSDLLNKNGFIIIKSNKIAKIKDGIKYELIKKIKYILNSKKIPFPDTYDFDNLIKYIFKIDKKNKCEILKSLYELFPSDPKNYRLSTNNFFLTQCKKLGIKKPLISTGPQLRIDRPKDKKFKTAKHQDYWYSFLSDNALTIWFNLTEIKKLNGPLIVYKESHKKGFYKFMDKKKGTYSLKNKSISKPKNIFLKKNEFLVFNQFLVHESGENLSLTPRVTIQLRYNDLYTLKKFTSSFIYSSSNYVTSLQKKSISN